VQARKEEGRRSSKVKDDDGMLTPTGYSPPTQQPIWPTAYTAHSQHCGYTALPPGQKTNPRRRRRTDRPHSNGNGLCSPLSKGPDPGSAKRHVNAGSPVQTALILIKQTANGTGPQTPKTFSSRQLPTVNCRSRSARPDRAALATTVETRGVAHTPRARPRGSLLAFCQYRQ